MSGRNNKNMDYILLKKACECGNPQAVAEIYEKYKSCIWEYIILNLRSRTDGHDLLQAVFLRICEGRCRYNGRSDVAAYLRGITRNVLREHIKTRNRIHEVPLWDEIEVYNDIPREHSQHEEPLLTSHSVQARQALVKAIPQLPRKSRHAIELVYFRRLNVSQAEEHSLAKSG